MIYSEKHKVNKKTKRIQSAIKGKNYFIQIGSIPASSRPQSVHLTINVPSRALTPQYTVKNNREVGSSASRKNKSLENGSRKQLLLKIKSAQQSMDKKIIRNQVRTLPIQGLMNLELVDESLRWWPLEGIQKFLIKKKNQQHNNETIHFDSSRSRISSRC